MFKLFFLACTLALAAAEPKPEPSVVYSYGAPVATYPAVSAPLVAAAYAEPVSTAYSAPFAYSAYPAPLAYSAYSYASPFSYAYAYRR